MKALTRRHLRGVMLVAAALAAMTLYLTRERRSLARDFANRVDDMTMREICCWCMVDPPTCFDRSNDDACYRELYRVQIEAWEANRLTFEIKRNSPTGVAFVRPTRVRTLVTTR